MKLLDPDTLFENTLTLGPTGLGKTWRTLLKLLRLIGLGLVGRGWQIVAPRHCGMVVQDKAGHLAKLLAYFGWVYGFGHLLLYDAFSQYQRILPFLHVE